MNPEMLEKINKFTRRSFTEEELYTFSVILCDNEIDRDSERFSDEALESLREKFIGRTGIFDHNPSSANQTARIFDTEIIVDSSRNSKCGEPYKYLKASVYMVRTDENRNLIAEIDGGIKKEVSISCSAEKRVCSICGCDKAVKSCNHVKGKMYGNKLCHTILSNITDTYEWSFVAVPAQINAGVIKRYGSDIENVVTEPIKTDIIASDAELRRDIRKLAYFVGGRDAVEIAIISSQGMSTQQLINLKKSFEKRQRKSGGVEVQLLPDTTQNEQNLEFSMK